MEDIDSCDKMKVSGNVGDIKVNGVVSGLILSVIILIIFFF